MNPTIVSKKVTLPFAHEFEKLYETLVPRVSLWSKDVRKILTSQFCLDVHLFLMFSYHDETLELVFHILLEICWIVSSVMGKISPIVYRAGAHSIELSAILKPFNLSFPNFLTSCFCLLLTF